MVVRRYVGALFAVFAVIVGFTVGTAPIAGAACALPPCTDLAFGHAGRRNSLDLLYRSFLLHSGHYELQVFDRQRQYLVGVLTSGHVIAGHNFWPNQWHHIFGKTPGGAHRW